MRIRSFAVRRALGQLAEGRAPFAPLPLNGLWALRFTFRFEPSAGETRFPQSAPDVWASPHEIPHQTGSVVLDHHDDRTLIQTVIQRADPVAECRIQAGAQTVFAAQVGVCANKFSKRVSDELGRKRKRRRDSTGRERAIIRSLGYAPGFVHPEISISVFYGLRRRSRTVASAHPPAVGSIPTESLRIVLRVALLHAHSTAAVLQIIQALGLHEPIANSAKIEPTVA